MDDKKTARIRTQESIPWDLIQFTAAIIDQVGDRRAFVLTCAVLSVAPFQVIHDCHQIGLLWYLADDNRLLRYDPARDDYIPYTSEAGPWWNAAFYELAEHYGIIEIEKEEDPD